jgi:hypothetical protein
VTKKIHVLQAKKNKNTICGVGHAQRQDLHTKYGGL